MKVLVALLTVFGIVLAVPACQTPHGPSKAPLPWRCGDKLIPLDEAKTLMAACQVTAIYQAHQGPVAIDLVGGDSVCFHQPRIDWVFFEARRACPSANITETTE